MDHRQRLLYSITTFLMLICNNSHAAEQTIKLYYGLGGGVVVPQVNELDSGVLGELVLGVEENGWALEAVGFTSLETGTDAPTIDYSVQGYHLGLSYRSIMRNDSYYIFKIASTDMDFDFSGEITGTAPTSGINYSVGAGWRMASNQKLEAIYSYYDSDDIQDPIHMATLRYLWDNSPGTGSDAGSGGRAAFYSGAMLGLLEPDLGGEFDVAHTYGLLLGYDLGLASAPGLSIELLLGASAETDSFLSEPDFPDAYTTSYIGLYGVFRTPGTIYLKGRLGFINVKFEDELYIQTGPGTFELDEVDKFSDSGLSYGVGAGLKAGKNIRLELEYTKSSFNISGLNIDPEIASLSFLYTF
ncbi:hypothetical protein MNBD_GAMMA11-642 [hydrothermal vent metagenome]|uniref:Outer membrane protein beta-barrel domain-containing protein n=1 Tax=hydrothermal vent metagenome TaxID=652676 RepID=A0A3B0X603_9ZZZZ